MSELILSYSEDNVDTDWGNADNHPSDSVQNSSGGQALTMPADVTWGVTSFKLWMKKSGSPTGTAVARLYAASGSHPNAVPTGSSLASVNFDISTLTTSYALYEFTFDTPYTTTPSNLYCIVLENPGSGIDVSNYPIYGVDADNDPDSEGNQVRYENGSWVANDRGVAYYLYGTTTSTSTSTSTTTTTTTSTSTSTTSTSTSTSTTSTSSSTTTTTSTSTSTTSTSTSTTSTSSSTTTTTSTSTSTTSTSSSTTVEFLKFSVEDETPTGIDVSLVK